MGRALVNLRWLIVLLITAGVSACGFQLRGTGLKSLNQQKISIISETPFGEVERSLKRNLKASGANLTSVTESEFHIAIQRIDIQQLGASRDATGRANEIILLATLEYELSQSKTERQKKGELKVRRSYFQDYRNPVSEQTLRTDTRQQIFEELATRLSNQVAWMANQ